jgi:hypothetical protein
MAQQASFGRRQQVRPAPPPARDNMRETPAPEPRIEPAFPRAGHVTRPTEPEPLSVEEELAQWNALRKARRRSFREPWRTVAIAASVMFGLSTWMLPASVNMIVQVMLFGLFGASVYAGLRRR